MTNREQIALMWNQLAANPTAYFEQLSGNHGWQNNGCYPTEEDNLDHWRVTIPPNKWEPKEKKYFYQPQSWGCFFL